MILHKFHLAVPDAGPGPALLTYVRLARAILGDSGLALNLRDGLIKEMASRDGDGEFTHQIIRSASTAAHFGSTSRTDGTSRAQPHVVPGLRREHRIGYH
jgi:hypothetical protein